jgi:hypothetical protein
VVTLKWNSSTQPDVAQVSGTRVFYVLGQDEQVGSHMVGSWAMAGSTWKLWSRCVPNGLCCLGALEDPKQFRSKSKTITQWSLWLPVGVVEKVRDGRPMTLRSEPYGWCAVSVIGMVDQWPRGQGRWCARHVTKETEQANHESRTKVVPPITTVEESNEHCNLWSAGGMLRPYIKANGYEQVSGSSYQKEVDASVARDLGLS